MPANVTPMMRQYLELKEQYSDCLLFFRLGDFYEMFFEDAETASKELELVLTGRDCGLDERAPMCGVPYHSVDNYISRLIEKGYKVAICEQLEDPSTAKGLVERGIVRIVTPGTIIEERMLDEGSNNFIACIYADKNAFGLAYSDVSTGAFFACEFHGVNAALALWDEIARIRPAQVIVNELFYQNASMQKRLSSSAYLEKYAPHAFLKQNAREALLQHFKVHNLECFGCEDDDCLISAAGALLSYLEETQKNTLAHIKTLQLLQRADYMQLDASTRRNLELTQPLRTSGNKKNTLLFLLDHTQTAMGRRMLRDWIDRPLQNVAEIQARLDATEECRDDMAACEILATDLNGVYDFERLCSRIVYGTVHARDCLSLCRSLKQIPVILAAIESFGSKRFFDIRDRLDPMEDISSLLNDAISPDAPLSLHEGGIIKDGYHAEVDELRKLTTGSKHWLSDFEARQRAQTGIKNLRIGYNRVFGYYIEVTKSYQQMVPYDYERKQTLSNAERYVTAELKEMEHKLLSANERLIALEYELFIGIRDTLSACIARLQENAALVAELDCYQSFAQVAAQMRYIKPTVMDDGILSIKNGRHPVVERTLREGFIPNDAYLDGADDRLLIITGPNMAGKSTYLRQTALISLMAHIGSFVPADEARIPLMDRIFTRVGASDDLSAGQSTFMVEMSEMANILNHATNKSFLILDEIGRGTSTFDGLSIAWAVLEHIADSQKCGAKTLFATHYHELAELEGKIGGVKNYRIAVKELGDDILFLRKIVRGDADKSFGIQVAKLAGLPVSVVTRAQQILLELENADIARDSKKKGAPGESSVSQISLFDVSVEDSVIRLLRDLDPNQITPIEALVQLQAVCNVLHGEEIKK